MSEQRDAPARADGIELRARAKIVAAPAAARCGPPEACEQRKQRGFAAAIGADDACVIAAIDRKIDVAQNARTVDIDADVFESDQGSVRIGHFEDL